jgi:hypothetical protein
MAAARRRLPAVVTHLFDGPVALASCAELALSLQGAAACALDPHVGLAAFPAFAIPQLDDASRVVPAAVAGLGIPAENEEVAAWRS